MWPDKTVLVLHQNWASPSVGWGRQEMFVHLKISEAEGRRNPQQQEGRGAEIGRIDEREHESHNQCFGRFYDKQFEMFFFYIYFAHSLELPLVTGPCVRVSCGSRHQTARSQFAEQPTSWEKFQWDDASLWNLGRTKKFWFVYFRY